MNPAELRRLWGPGAGDRLRRGPGGDREDSLAPGTAAAAVSHHGPAVAGPRAATSGRAGAELRADGHQPGAGRSRLRRLAARRGVGSQPWEFSAVRGFVRLIPMTCRCLQYRSISWIKARRFSPTASKSARRTSAGRRGLLCRGRTAPVPMRTACRKLPRAYADPKNRHW